MKVFSILFKIISAHCVIAIKGFGLAEANANRLPGKFTNPGFQSTNFLNLNTVTPPKNKDDVHSRAKKYGAYHLCRGSSSMACDSQGRRYSHILIQNFTTRWPSHKSQLMLNSFYPSKGHYQSYEMILKFWIPCDIWWSIFLLV